MLDAFRKTLQTPRASKQPDYLIDFDFAA